MDCERSMCRVRGVECTGAGVVEMGTMRSGVGWGGVEGWDSRLADTSSSLSLYSPWFSTMTFSVTAPSWLNGAHG